MIDLDKTVVNLIASKMDLEGVLEVAKSNKDLKLIRMTKKCKKYIMYVLETLISGKS